MSSILSQKIQNVPASPTLVLAAKARELKAEGKDVISLSVGEPDWGTFNAAKSAGHVAIDEEVTKYTPASGLKELRAAIAEQTNGQYGMNFNFENVTVSSGGKFVIYSALNSILNPGDEVIIPAPFWVSYPTMVELAGGVPKIVHTTAENRFKMTADELSSAITPQTRLLMFNSPSNPTGQVYTRRELESIAEVLKKNPQLVVLSDDIYNRLVFNEEGLAPHFLQGDPELKSRLLMVSGASKSFSMTGWRIGWAVGPTELIQAMGRFQSQAAGCASSISQMATLGAIQNADKEFRMALTCLKERMVHSCEEFSRLEKVHLWEPQGAFYLWVDVTSYLGRIFEGQVINKSREFASELLRSESVAVVPGVDFGQEGFIRVSFAIDNKRMSEAVSRIKKFLSEFKST